jgi:hypothetical protein
MAIQKKPLHQDASTLLTTVPITVEHEIGRLTVDDKGESLLIAAMRIVAEHESQHDEQYGNATTCTYHLPTEFGPATVQISYP